MLIKGDTRSLDYSSLEHQVSLGLASRASRSRFLLQVMRFRARVCGCSASKTTSKNRRCHHIPQPEALNPTICHKIHASLI